METKIALAETDAEIARCYAVMSQLRPHIVESDFVQRVRRQMAGGYRLAFLETDLFVRAVAGYRYFEALVWGRVCYVDDLVTDERERSRGHGDAMLKWLIERAKEAGCEQFHLDSGVQRFAAHRFYFTRRMTISAYHFSLDLRVRE